MENKKQIYIIEHLEPKLFDWCLFEYENISRIVGKKNLWFTNIKDKKEAEKLKKFGKVFLESVHEIKMEDACVLDPEANELLNPKEALKFKYFIFGGILGDYPPKKRTRKELTKFLKDAIARNIGKKQMSTDNAVLTVFKIAKGERFENLKFKDKISIKINEFENVDLPYRYNLIKIGGKEKPFVSDKVIDYLKKKKGF